MLDIIIGPMFAEKAKEITRYIQEHKDVAILTSKTDNRGVDVDSDIVIDGLQYIDPNLSEYNPTTETIILQEAHHFKNLGSFVEKYKEKNILVVGRIINPNETESDIKNLLAIADRITNVYNSCFMCNKKALYDIYSHAIPRGTYVPSDFFDSVCNYHLKNH